MTLAHHSSTISGGLIALAHGWLRLALPASAATSRTGRAGALVFQRRIVAGLTAGAVKG